MSGDKKLGSSGSISKFFGYNKGSTAKQERGLTMKDKVKESIRRGDSNVDPWYIEEEQEQESAGQIIDHIKFNDFLNYYESKDHRIK